MTYFYVTFIDMGPLIFYLQKIKKESFQFSNKGLGLVKTKNLKKTKWGNNCTNSLLKKNDGTASVKPRIMNISFICARKKSLFFF